VVVIIALCVTSLLRRPRDEVHREGFNFSENRTTFSAHLKGSLRFHKVDVFCVTYFQNM